jgi:hypothetical protein
MNTKLVIAIGAVVALALSGPVQAQGERLLTTTLLPVSEAGTSKESGAGAGLLWVQNSPPQDVYLKFDLSGLPAGLQDGDLLRCTLRMVAQKVTYVPQNNRSSGGPQVIVKGERGNDNFTPVPKAMEVVSLSTLNTKNIIAQGAADGLRKAVYQQYAVGKPITLRLHTDSHKASSLLYSSGNSGANPSNLPRLVVEYKLPAADLLESAGWTQMQHDPEHTGRSPWRPFRAPSNFTLARIAVPRIDQAVAAVADYPLIYQGNLYVIGKVGNQNFLFGLDFKGAERWRQNIGLDVVQRSPVISRSGILYLVTESQIAAYDLNQQGKGYATSNLTGKPSAYTDLTQGNDGSLYLALVEQDVHFIYGFTAALKPFLKSAALAKGQEKVSTVTVSPDGRRIFAQTPAGAVAIDVANPSDQSALALGDQQHKPFEYYHTPVAAPVGGAVVYADFTGKANNGHLWGATSDQQIWSADVTLLPQPVLGSDGFVHYLQDSSLQAHRADQAGTAEVLVKDASINATSNLVMDGADNLYFWNNGYLQGYSANGKALFERILLTSEVQERGSQSIEGPEQFLRLMLAPDGTLWANNKNGDSLFAFKPVYSTADLALEQKDVQSQTVYRATGKLSVGAVKVPQGNLLLQAQNGVGFAAGFTVQRGVSILVRTGS